MTRTFPVAALAACLFALPAVAQAATVEQQISILISEKGSKSNKGVLLPLKHNSITYAKQHGIVALEATGGGTVQTWHSGGNISVPYWSDVSRSAKKTLACNQNYSTTTCEIR